MGSSNDRRYHGGVIGDWTNKMSFAGFVRTNCPTDTFVPLPNFVVYYNKIILIHLCFSMVAFTLQW